MKLQKQHLEFHKRTILTSGLTVIFLWSLLSVNWSMDLFHSGGRTTIIQIIQALVHPDLSPEILKIALMASYRTLAYAVAGMTLAIVIALFLGILASGVLNTKRNKDGLSINIYRLFLGAMRSIHELVWAWLFVAAIGLSPFAAIFALAIPYGGTLGRIFADILNDVPKEPIRSLRASGATRTQLLIYGYLPMSITDMLSYTMYRFECAIRSSSIMSFVGLGGLGYQIQLSLADLEYSEVWTFVFFLIALVVLIDVWSNSLRKRLFI